MQRALIGRSVAFRRMLISPPFSFTNITRMGVNKYVSVRLFSDDSRHRASGEPKRNLEAERKVKEKERILYQKMKSQSEKSAAAQSSNRMESSPERPLYFTGSIGKYTHSLFDSAVKSNSAEKIESELIKLIESYNTDKKLQFQLTSPIARKEEKLKLAHQWSTGTSETLIKLIERMVNEDRIRDFPSIAQNYSRLLAEKLGHIHAVIYSAQSLTPKQLQRIEQNLQKVLKPGQKFVFTTQLMPKLLGGLKIRMGDRELDLSVSSKIMQFEQVFRSALGMR